MSPVAGESTRGAGRGRGRGPAVAGDRFVPAVRAAAAPIAVWALHFALMYAGIAAGCRAGADVALVAGWPVLRWVLLGMTLPVVSWLGWVVAKGVVSRAPAAGDDARSRGHDDRQDAWSEGRGTGPWLGRVATSGFAFVAVVWETVPVFFLPLCGP